MTRVHPAREFPEARARAYARAVLVSQAKQETLMRFVEEFDVKWRARTVCAPEWRSHPRCGN